MGFPFITSNHVRAGTRREREVDVARFWTGLERSLTVSGSNRAELLQRQACAKAMPIVGPVRSRQTVDPARAAKLSEPMRRS
jgi:hypothetical protein